MKRLFPLMIAAGLMLAPSALAQDKKDPTKPAPPTAPAAIQPAKKDAPKTDVPKKDDKAAAPAGAPDMAAMEKAYEEAAKVGPNHEILKQMEGEWDVEVTDLMTPGAKPEKGTMTNKLVLGGRFLTMDYDGRMHGKFFRGVGQFGYSNTDKRFEATWSDSMSTCIAFMTGSYDSAGKVFTMAGDFTDPMSGAKGKQKEVTTITSKDSHKSEFYMTIGGKESKVMEIVYTRAAKGDKPKADPKDTKPATPPKGK